MRWVLVSMFAAASIIAISGSESTGLVLPVIDFANPALEMRLRELEPKLERFANYTPGLVAITVSDVQGRMPISINGDENLPAASVIKLAVMVEVMRQWALGRFSLERQVTLYPQDRDCGSGALCDMDAGMRFSVGNLTRIMIDNSDNTATNMLIRLVGRNNINDTMAGLGLTQTWLGNSIHSDERSIRSLRTSTNDMMRLLVMIAGRRLVNERASDTMMSILAGQRHNELLPEPLPKDVLVAHKTGTLHDTLNDVGIVDLQGSPYIICVITTHLDDLDDGARLIREVSRATYNAFVAAKPAIQIIPAVSPTPTSSDVPDEPSPSALPSMNWNSTLPQPKSSP